MGRTGTFITLDAMVERLKERDDLNIFEFVNEMRTRRKQMVQTVVSTWQNVIVHVTYIVVSGTDSGEFIIVLQIYRFIH